MPARMPNKLEIRELEKGKWGVLYEFFVDGESLARKLGISDRPRCMEFSSFDLDYVVEDKEHFPHCDSLLNITNTVEAFLGKRQPSNQFDSGRIVLYRCHCGCDYCGVISLQLLADGELVCWRDIRYECVDHGQKSSNYTTKNLMFQKEAYLCAFERYLTDVKCISSIQERAFYKDI